MAYRDKTSFAIFDAGGASDFGDEFRQLDNAIVSDQYAGFTVEAKHRLSEKVLENVTAFLAKELEPSAMSDYLALKEFFARKM